MIRGNWSLAQEFKQNERKQQSKVQQRQKHKHKLEKLKNTDPIKLYHRIENLESKESKTDRDEDYLKSLKEDWSFIEKNNLHQGKIKKFLEEKRKQERLNLKKKSKLWGDKSIYFNPELNPLGKVPNVTHLNEEIASPLENLTVPLRDKIRYQSDPLINELSVTLPKGEPPRFYKLIQNTEKPKRSKESNSNNEDHLHPKKNFYLNQEKESSHSIRDKISSEESDLSEQEPYEPDLKKVKYG
ncbi:hypothetical protein CANMA_001435 [Candida margitis]|uniref:uncharacterized protein n=1 Tax=Candida margitis TaxID=1775924 RepID=UPI00222648F6|nr:uncharacterized protein CANMA_001435 [Candida margitis]KAI5969368.1 hypothetical protein CANMA_001435 [Candida margitis]